MPTGTHRVFLYLAAAFYTGAGTLHFLRPAPYLKIMPPSIPWPLTMVWVSGAAEIAGGLGLLVPALRTPAAWGLVALLISVFPANLYMATNHIQITQKPVPAWIAWARLPVQGVLIGWVLWCSGAIKQYSK